MHLSIYLMDMEGRGGGHAGLGGQRAGLHPARARGFVEEVGTRAPGVLHVRLHRLLPKTRRLPAVTDGCRRSRAAGNPNV